MTRRGPRLYRLALHLLPRAFRDAHGAAMAQAHADLAQDARARGGWPGAVAYALREYRELVRVAWRQRRPSRSTAPRTERDRRGPGPMLDALARDARHAVRALAAAPGFTAVAVLTLAVGIGAATAIFSIVDGVVLRPLAVPQPDRLVTLWETGQASGRRMRVPPGSYADWRTKGEAFQDLGMFGAMVLTFTSESEPEQIFGAQVDGGYFPTLGVAPLLGRGIAGSDALEGGPDVVVLSYGLWQRRFGGRADIIGRTARLDGRPYEIVGVMPPGLYPTWPATVGGLALEPRYGQYWVPMRLGAFGGNRTAHVFGVVGRLKAGASLRQAQASMDTEAARLAAAYPGAYEGEGILVTRLADEVTGAVRPALVLLLAAVGLLLLIGCANLATLSLARASARARDLAVCAALGATRARLARSLLVESALVALAGGALGTAAAAAGLGALVSWVPASVPRLDAVAVNGPVLAFAIAVSARDRARVRHAAGAARLAPRHAGRASSGKPRRHRLARPRADAARARRRGGRARLRAGGRRGPARPQLRAPRRRGRGLRSGERAHRRAQPAARRVRARAAGGDPARAPGSAARAPRRRVRRARLRRPAVGDLERRLRHPGRDLKDDGAAWQRIVSAGYLRTVRIPVLRGRGFTETDDEAHPRVVIVNEAFARRYFPDADPIGRRMIVPAPTRPAVAEAHEIVGVVGDVRFLGPAVAAEPAFYLPIAQFPQADLTVLVRTSGDPLAVAPALRAAVHAVDPALPVGRVTTLEALADGSVAQPRFTAVLVGTFGVMAFLLAALGIYGLLAYTVSQRRREIGVRLALGARPRDVTRLVVGDGLAVTLAGVAAGLAAAAVLDALRAEPAVPGLARRPAHVRGRGGRARGGRARRELGAAPARRADRSDQGLAGGAEPARRYRFFSVARSKTSRSSP